MSSKLNKKKFLLILFITLFSSISVTALTTSPENQTFGEPLVISPSLLQKYKTSFKSPDLQPIYAYAKVQYSNQYLAYDQAQIALDYLSLAQESQNASLISLRNQYISDAMATLKFMTTYLVNSRVRDKNGIIEFWDTSLQDATLTRVSKIARDQALTLLAIDKLLTFIDHGYSVENSTYLFYKESFSNIWTFLQSLYDQINGGWYTKTTPINESTFSIDTTKRTADNMIIISSLADISHVSLLEANFTKTKLDTILTKSMDLFMNKFIVPNEGIASFGSADGSFVSTNTFFAKENTLYGLANLDLFRVTGNKTYETNAEAIWSYIKNKFWEIGFGGLFIGITAQSDPVIAGKSIEDQIFFAMLSLELASLNPNNSNYLSYYLKMVILIKHNFIKGTSVASSTDLRFNPSSEYYVRSVAYYIKFILNIPHVSLVTVPKSIIVGNTLPTKIYISNLRNLLLNISIGSTNSFNPVSIVTNKSLIEQDLSYESNVPAGSQKLEFNISISKTPIQQLYVNTNLSPNVRIPNGLVYLLGAGVLAGLVIIVRRPPQFIKKYIQDLKIERQPVTESDEGNET